MSPLLASPFSSSALRASGTEAEEVLPDRTTSRAMTVRSGSPSRLAISSMMRRLAWCGANTSMSSGPTPARSMAVSSVAVSRVVAHRYTACPAMLIAFSPSGMAMALDWSPSLPHTTGPTAGVSEGPRTAAPAPSAKITAVDRSVRSV